MIMSKRRNSFDSIDYTSDESRSSIGRRPSFDSSDLDGIDLRMPLPEMEFEAGKGYRITQIDEDMSKRLGLKIGDHITKLGEEDLTKASTTTDHDTKINKISFNMNIEVPGIEAKRGDDVVDVKQNAAIHDLIEAMADRGIEAKYVDKKGFEVEKDSSGVKKGDIITHLDGVDLKSGDAEFLREGVRNLRFDDPKEFMLEGGNKKAVPPALYQSFNRQSFDYDDIDHNPLTEKERLAQKIAVEFADKGIQGEYKDGKGFKVSEIEPDSIAAKLGLKKGDLITKFGEEDLKSIDWDKVNKISNENSAQLKDRKKPIEFEVDIGVIRSNKQILSGSAEELDQRALEAKYNPPSSQGLGIKAFYDKDKGFIITDVIEGSTAAKKLGLKKGDILSSFGDKDLKNLTQEKLLETIEKIRDAGLDGKPIKLQYSRDRQKYEIKNGSRSQADLICKDGKVRKSTTLKAAESVVKGLDAADQAWKKVTEPGRARLDKLRMNWQTDPTQRSVANRFRQLRNFTLLTLPVQVANIPIKTVALLSHTVKAAAIGVGMARASSLGYESKTCNTENLKKTGSDAKGTAWNLLVATTVVSTVATVGAMGVGVPVLAIGTAAIVSAGVPAAVAAGLVKADVDLAVAKKLVIIGEYAKFNPKTLAARAPEEFDNLKGHYADMQDQSLSINKRREAQQKLKEEQEHLANKVNPMTSMPGSMVRKAGNIIRKARGQEIIPNKFEAQAARMQNRLTTSNLAPHSSHSKRSFSISSRDEDTLSTRSGYSSSSRDSENPIKPASTANITPPPQSSLRAQAKKYLGMK